jgi:hypothetical protein
MAVSHSEQLAEARAAIGELLALLDRVEVMHQPYKFDPDCCSECDQDWPCPTIEAIKRG